MDIDECGSGCCSSGVGDSRHLCQEVGDTTSVLH